MDPNIVKDTVDLFAPLLPFLIPFAKAAAAQAGKKVAETAVDKATEKGVEKVGEFVWGKVKSGWDKLFPALEKTGLDHDALRDLTAELEDPDEQEDAKGELRRKVRKAIKEDEDLAAALRQLIADVVPQSGMAIESSSVIRDGNGNIVIQGNQGPVTVNVRQAPPQSGEAPEAPRTKYLNRIFSGSRRLELETVVESLENDPDKHLKLESVYTSLLTLDTEERDVWRKDPRDLREVRRITALARLNGERKLVLLGDPGGGKSTFVRFVAGCLAGELLGRPEANLEVLRRPLKEGDPEDSPLFEPQSWDRGAPIPVCIVLRDFVASGVFPPAGKEATAKHVMDFLRQDRDGENGAFIDELDAELLDKGGLFLIDGLDEVTETDSRRDQIKQAIEDLAGTYLKCRFLVTSRTYAYQKQNWKLDDFAEAVLAPFDKVQIDFFVEQWYRHFGRVRNLTADDAQGRAMVLKKAITDRERLFELAERPLLLTLMAANHALKGGELPDRRHELYEDSVNLLLNHWEKQRQPHNSDGSLAAPQPSLTAYLKCDQRKLRTILEELAYLAHAGQADLAGTADIAESDLMARLLNVNPDQSPDRDRLLEYLRLRSGLLIERGVGVYTLPHRTFQEYLSACHLLSHDDYPDNIAGLARRSYHQWREVALLAAARDAATRRNTIWQFVQALCENTDTETAQWSALLAGQALEELGDLGTLSEANEQHYDHVRTRLVEVVEGRALPAVERALGGKVLASLGDPRFKEKNLFLPEDPLLGFIEIHAGEFTMGSDGDEGFMWEKETPKGSVDLPSYYISRFPITWAQYRLFAKETEREVRSSDAEQANCPVTNVNWGDAMAYCTWLNGKLSERAASAQNMAETEAERRFWNAVRTGQSRVSLPSEAEWEKAARGPGSGVYPWGDQPDPERANYDDTNIAATSAVGCFSCGEGDGKICDLSGNVWEWTRSSVKDYPYDPKPDRLDNPDLAKRDRYVLRGGAFYFVSGFVRCAIRGWSLADGRGGDVGFRVVLSPFSDL